jgi:hypothetical protein
MIGGVLNQPSAKAFCVEREDDTQNKEEIDGVYKTKLGEERKTNPRLYK